MNENTGWLTRLRTGLKRTSHQLTGHLKGLVMKNSLDQSVLDDLEDILIASDMGIHTAQYLVKEIAKEHFHQNASLVDIQKTLSEKIADILRPVACDFPFDPTAQPHVVFIVGVNGAGKTTTVGKLANLLSSQGRSVMFAAADTFRAGAVDQLKIWGKRVGCEVFAASEGSDPASLVYESMLRAREKKMDYLFIDTAGRLQNKQGLMDELKKMVRVMKKNDEKSPHTTLLILDATTGQNAFSQVALFDQQVKIDGLVMTKLDGTARGGAIVGLAQQHQKPIYALGVGEHQDDLRAFDADVFSRCVVGLDDQGHEA